MTLTPKDYLKEFREYAGQELEKSDVKSAISEQGSKLVNEIVTQGSSSLSQLAGGGASISSSFGIGLGLGLLGVFLARKYRTSPTAKFIARLLGTDVDKLNTKLVLEKLSNRDYFFKIQQKVINLIISGRQLEEAPRVFVDEFQLSMEEANTVYKEVKDIFLDTEIFSAIKRSSESLEHIELEIRQTRKEMESGFEKVGHNAIHISDQLLESLNQSRKSYEERNIPFRTPNLLYSLFKTSNSLAKRSFDKIQQNLGQRYEIALMSYIVKQSELESGSKYMPFDWYEREDVKFAQKEAFKEGSPVITEKHLFLGILQSNSRTSKGIRDQLGEKKFLYLLELVRQERAQINVSSTPGSIPIENSDEKIL